MNILPGQKFDQKLLKNPPLECEVTYSWLWNEPVTREGIDERLEGFVKAGIRSLYILPLPKDFRPETLRTFLSPEYLTKEFWDIVNYAMRKCVELGIKPWIYDEGGWPSGAAGRRTEMQYPDAPALKLADREITLMAGEKYIPCEDLISAFDGKTRIYEGFCADKDITVKEFYINRTPHIPYFIDFTDEKVTETFINNTYEGYKSIVGDLFGNTVPLFFTDEPGLARYTLPKGLFEGFIEKYGYDLCDYIYVIPDNGVCNTEKENQARIDYFTYTGELFYKNTFVKLSEWCEKNGIAYSGHVMADNYPDACRNGYASVVDVLRTMQIPGIDVIWEQIRWPYGGRQPVDEEETERMPFFTRIATSAARQMKRNLALTETYSIYGDGISPDEMRYASNYQAVRGINVFNFLTLPYGKTRCSALMMRPAFCPEKPGFGSLAHINKYYARLAYLLRLGYAEGDTALYHPCTDYMASEEISAAAVESFRAAGVELEEKNISFDIIDDKGIREAVICDGGLKLGDAVYRHIVVPANKYMPEDVKAKIAPYLGAGEPTYTFKNDKLRVYTRLLDSGRLWFVFNEGEPTVSEKLTLSGGKNIYRIDLANGDAYIDTDCELTLTCGDIAVYYVTDDVIDTLPSGKELVAEISELKPLSYNRFVITYDGLTNEYGYGMPKVDRDFSGEITLEGEYTLAEEPCATDTYLVTLEGFGVTARVTLGGEEHPLGMSPMAVTVSGAELSKNGKVSVVVANTAANEILAKDDIINSHPKAEVGLYQDRTRIFEARRHPLKIGKIKIERLI
ncbi:MAG: hypothetical protein IJE25_03205 [Clostridia bacterium]|nr:hypothetical protein [Clostridia bacterium]